MPGCGEADEEKGGGSGRGNLGLQPGRARPRTDSRIVGSRGGWSRLYCGTGPASIKILTGVLQSFSCTAMLVSALPLHLGLPDCLVGLAVMRGHKEEPGPVRSLIPHQIRVKLGGCAERPVFFLLSGKSLTAGGETGRCLNERLNHPLEGSRSEDWQVETGRFSHAGSA